MYRIPESQHPPIFGTLSICADNICIYSQTLLLTCVRSGQLVTTCLLAVCIVPFHTRGKADHPLQPTAMHEKEARLSLPCPSSTNSSTQQIIVIANIFSMIPLCFSHLFNLSFVIRMGRGPKYLSRLLYLQVFSCSFFFFFLFVPM